MKKIKIGFLPLYIKLYDDSGSGARARPRLEPFYEKLAEMLEAEGLEVIRAPFCRIDDCPLLCGSAFRICIPSVICLSEHI